MTTPPSLPISRFLIWPTNTRYQFTLEDGEVIELKGNEDVEYDGEIHSAANLFDALKEGYYGKF